MNVNKFYDKHASAIWICIFILAWGVILLVIPGCGGANKHMFYSSREYMKQLNDTITQQEDKIEESKRDNEFKESLVGYYEKQLRKTQNEVSELQSLLWIKEGEIAKKTQSEVKVLHKLKQHVVLTGDWLSRIAYKEYGKIVGWVKIWEANKYIRDPDLIYVDQVISLPYQLTPADIAHGKQVHEERY